MDIIIGTAGHIDHGKTSLVKALTGVDADRLPEEKERGITIDIGFAELDLGDLHVGFVDVPGHERFVKNMLAGASGIDMVVLVVAADEGVKPQTREHFEICRLLKVKTGFTVLTKCDLADRETIELARMDVEALVTGSFLESAPILQASAKTGEGTALITQTIRDLASRIAKREQGLVARLPIDRSFSVKGFGAVVTGTLSSGELRAGQDLELLPSGKKVRVRGLQSHGRHVESVVAGTRAAVNLGGVDHSEIWRGMTLSEPGVLVPTQMVDAKIEAVNTSQTIKSRQRVRVHIGTSEVLARIHILNDEGALSPGEGAFVQLRMESPVVAIPKERFIIRSYSPQTTIAGGEVLQNSPPKRRRRDLKEFAARLEDLAGDEARQVEALLAASGAAGLSMGSLQSRTGKTRESLGRVLGGLTVSGTAIVAGEFYLHAADFTALSERTAAAVKAFHAKEPLAKGMPAATLKEAVFRHLHDALFVSVLHHLTEKAVIVTDREVVRLSSHSTEMSADETRCLDFFRKRYQEAGLEVPKLDESFTEARALSGLSPEKVRKVFQILLDSGELLKISDDFYFSKGSIEGLKSVLRDYADSSVDRLIDVAAFKQAAGLSRKYSIPLLEYFDRERVTRRAGDKRVIL